MYYKLNIPILHIIIYYIIIGLDHYIKYLTLTSFIILQQIDSCLVADHHNRLHRVQRWDAQRHFDAVFTYCDLCGLLVLSSWLPALQEDDQRLHDAAIWARRFVLDAAGMHGRKLFYEFAVPPLDWDMCPRQCRPMPES